MFWYKPGIGDFFSSNGNFYQVVKASHSTVTVQKVAHTFSKFADSYGWEYAYKVKQPIEHIGEPFRRKLFNFSSDQNPEMFFIKLNDYERAWFTHPDDVSILDTYS